MPDLGPFYAVFSAFVFGTAAHALIEAALRISAFAGADQSTSPTNDLTPELPDVTRTVSG